MTTNNKCPTNGCFRIPSNRGLCLVCYSKAKKMVEAGTTTWDELVSLGLALPSGPKYVDPFTKAFNEAKRGKDAETAAQDPTGHTEGS